MEASDMIDRLKQIGRATLLALACCTFLTGATTPNSAILPQTPLVKCIQFLQGTDAAATYKTVLTGGANATKVVGIFVTSFDPSASHLFTVQISSSTSGHCSPATSCFGGAAVTIPVSAGSAAAAPAINMMAPANWPGLPRDSDGNPFFYLTDNTWTVEATFATAITSTDWLNVCAVYGNF